MKNKKYLVIYSFVYPEEHDFFDTLEEAKQGILDAAINEGDIDKIQIFEIKREIDIESLIQEKG